MQVRNGNVCTQGFFFEKHDLITAGDRIARIAPPCFHADESEVLDASDGLVLPGLVDIHTHGAAGGDFSDGSPEALRAAAEYLGRSGTTSFLGTSMSLGEPEMTAAFRAAVPLAGKDAGGAVLRGFNMEGPFLSKKRAGAQDPRFLREPDAGLFDRLSEAAGGLIRLADLAPELPGALPFIRHAAGRCRVSLAHTEADYDTALAAFAAGASQVTHLFNAMPELAHRAPGVVAAAAERAEFAELICDGIHVHPAAVRCAFALFGPERICLISDSMRACGLPDGRTSLGGQPVWVKDGRATLADGTIAGSTATLADCLRKAVSFGIPLETAARCAAANPAKAAGLFGEVGSISEGKRADLLVLNADLSVRAVVIGGVRIR